MSRSLNKNPETGTVRINRFLADAGFGSRRGVEELILQGRVQINARLISQLGVRVNPASDIVLVDGEPVANLATGAVYAFHKPLGVVCTLKGQGGQPTLLPYKTRAELPFPVMPVGRLDSDSSGLLLWTDDGKLNQILCRPGSGIWKNYQVRLSLPLKDWDGDRFTGGGILLDGRPCLPCRLECLSDEGRLWLVSIHEGRRRQIRRMFRAVGNKVLDLQRLAVGPIKLGKLKPGDFRRVSHQDVEAVRDASTAKIRPQRKV